MKNAYEVQAPDVNLSPYTGMTKQHYIECAKYLLERAFKYVDSIETPLSFPSVPGKTYPQPNDPAWRYRSLEFEALERTFTLAGPLIHIDPEVTIRGIKLKDYYRLQLYNALTPGHPNSCLCRKSCPMQPTSSPASSAVCSKRYQLLPDVLWPSLYSGTKR
jgi:hypothetical protein